MGKSPDTFVTILDTSSRVESELRVNSRKYEFKDCSQVRNAGGLGKGLFATIDIPKNGIIIEYCGNVRTWDSWMAEKEKYLAMGISTNYTAGIVAHGRSGHSFVIDATLYGNNARYANHSHTPNARLDEVS